MSAKIPDAEEIVGAYLRDHPEVEELGARVAGKTPSSQTAPWVRLFLLDAPTRSGTVDHLIEFFLQLDCYAGQEAQTAHRAQAEASLLARTVRAALKDMPEAALDAVVTGVEVNGFRRDPDSDGFEPARERFIVTALVWMHG